MGFLTAWLLVPSSSHDGISSIPFYTKILSFIFQITRLCGGLEECLSLFFFLLGATLALRTKCVAVSTGGLPRRRSLVRSPTTVCFVIAAICYRARPRALKWALPASDYYDLRLNSSTTSTPLLLSPSSPSRNDIFTNGKFFRDELNRVAILRGVNLGGGSKLPTRPTGGETYRSSQTLHVDSKQISFVDRPFPLSDADEHFHRLAAWGFTFLRLQVTWEAVEHEGPGLYDEEYLQYLLELVRFANKYDINVFIDPHQDVWSRFTGGSGAPSWTLEKAGFNVKHLHKSGAAFVHQEWSSGFSFFIFIKYRSSPRRKYTTH